MDYTANLENKDLEYICAQITGRNLKKYYQSNPKKFNLIRPGFRAASLSDEEAEKLAVRYASKKFISDIICKCVNGWMDEIQKEVNDRCKDGVDASTALFMTLGKSVFDKNIELYFKLQDTEFPKEFIELCVGMQKALKDKEEAFRKKENDNITASEKPRDTDLSEKWAKEKQIYEEKVTTLENELNDCKSKLYCVQNECDITNDKLDKQSARLEELEQLAQASILEPEADRDDEYPYSSLCEIYEDWEGRQRLHRLTDIENGELLNDYMENIPGTSKLYPRGNYENGIVGIWDWKATPTESGGLYYETLYRPQYHVVEIIELEGCKSLQQLIETLKMGMEHEIHTAGMLFSFRSGADAWSGLFCEKTQMDVRGKNVQLKSNIYSLRKYIFTDDAMLLLNGHRYYRTFNLGMPQEMVRVNDPLQIVKTVFVQRINWTEMKAAGFHKPEYQEIRNYIEGLKTEELFHEIAVACECSDEEGKLLLNEFLHKAEGYLSGEDFETNVMAQIVQKNTELMSVCEAAIYERWEALHQEQISVAEQEKNKILQTVKEEEQHLAVIKKEKERTKQELEYINGAIDDQKRVAEKVRKNVDEQIEEAGRDASALISRVLLQLPVAQASGNKTKECCTASYVTGAELDNDAKEIYSTYHDLLDTISFELDEAGVDEEYARPMAAYLYSTYLYRIPIIVAGPNGKDIADALSVSLFHRFASVLHLNGMYDSDILEERSTGDEIIVIRNPFNSGWIDHLPSLLEDREHFYILDVPCAEELLIEPRSLYNYAIPLVTEPFITKRAGKEYVGGVCAEKFVHYKRETAIPQNRYNRYNTRLKMGPMLQNLYRQITSAICTLTDADSGRSMQYDILFSMLPYAFATGNLHELETIFNDYPETKKALTQDTQRRLEIYWEEKA